jgi:hypothetical protein
MWTKFRYRNTLKVKNSDVEYAVYRSSVNPNFLGIKIISTGKNPIIYADNEQDQLFDPFFTKIFDDFNRILSHHHFNNGIIQIEYGYESSDGTKFNINKHYVFDEQMPYFIVVIDITNNLAYEVPIQEVFSNKKTLIHPTLSKPIFNMKMFDKLSFYYYHFDMVYIGQEFYFETTTKKDLLEIETENDEYSFYVDSKGRKYIKQNAIDLFSVKYTGYFKLDKAYFYEPTYTQDRVNPLYGKISDPKLNDQFFFTGNTKNIRVATYTNNSSGFTTVFNYQNKAHTKSVRDYKEILELSRSKPDPNGPEMVKFLTETGIVEFPDFPGISTKEYEDEFIRLVEHKGILKDRSLFAFEFKFDIPRKY